MKFSQALFFSAISMAVLASSPVTVYVTPTVYQTVTVTAGDQDDAAETAESFSSYESSASSEISTKETTTLSPANTKVDTSSTAQTETATTSSAESTSTSSSGSTGKFSGDGTYYEVGGAAGACGEMHSDSELVVAIGHGLYDTEKDSTNVSKYCGKKINAHYGGKTVQVTVVDRCVGCTDTSLDFSPTAFQEFADESLGRIKITWDWA